jgi:hydroxymethylpyrimidine pyrophosphatase-like HAD family hydrolase
MEWIVTRISPMMAEEPQLSWQRNSIYLRFGHRDFQKGSSLSEIAHLYGLPAARCFAMGDSHNDLEMLAPAHAGMTACPANAVPEVQAQVLSHGGFVAPGIHGAGAIEALQHFFHSGNEL